MDFHVAISVAQKKIWLYVFRFVLRQMPVHAMQRDLCVFHAAQGSLFQIGKMLTNWSIYEF
jgi:hypothetical protein